MVFNSNFLYLISFVSSLILTFLVRKMALKNNIIDKPNERSSHTVPTPRGGGLAIVVVWFIGLILSYLNNYVGKELFFALASGFILALVSFLDDLFDLSPKVRLLAQALSAFGALYFLGGVQLFPGDNSILYVFGNLIFFVGIIWFINLYNFLDGIDAYAAQEAIVVSIGLIIFVGTPMLGILIASVSGFLVWNWPKAKIFMGDVGSTQLGFIIVVLGLYHHQSGEMELWYWLALTALFWFDASITLWRRWRNKEKLSQAHKKHAYQRIVQSGFSHQKTSLFAILLNLLFIAIIYLNHLFLPTLSVISLFLVIIICSFVYVLIERKKAF